MKTSISTNSNYNDLLLAKNWFGVAVILLVTGIFSSGCSDKEENMIPAKHMTMATTEKSGNTPFPVPFLKQGSADYVIASDNAIFLDAAQSGLFKRAFDDFKNRIYAKDGRLFVAPPTATEPAEAFQWYKIFYEAIAKTNELIEKGEITLEEVMQTWEYSYVPNGSNIKSDTIPPGSWNYTNYGGGFHALHLSNATTTWLLHNGQLGSAAIGFIGGAIPSAPVALTGFALFWIVRTATVNYGLYGTGTGVTIYTLIIGSTTFVIWYSYEIHPAQ